jgi:NAD(P)-dependent dehydrogenase (short-subunit alcohol dehydrogenase family)
MSLHPAFAAGAVAVITGAADGIGLAAAQRFVGLGMHVLMADRNEPKLAIEAAALQPVAAGHGARVTCRALDVSRYEDVAALKDEAYRHFGRVDVLMNNAGASQASGAWTALDAWRNIIDVNLWGIVHGVQAFTAAMLAQHSPAVIINTGSKQGITNPPGNPAYNVSKAGVKALTESLQHELRNTPGAQVSAHLLVPGYTYTGLTRQRMSSKPAGAWLPEQVVDTLLEAIARGSFYIICPDNEVSRADDAKRMVWAAYDMAEDRPPLSRWHADYQQAFKDFEP